MLAAAGYLVSPLDLIPEAVLPVIGLADDALVLSWLATQLVEETEAFLAWEKGSMVAGRPAGADAGGSRTAPGAAGAAARGRRTARPGRRRRRPSPATSCADRCPPDRTATDQRVRLDAAIRGTAP